jgi:hypothetical protein
MSEMRDALCECADYECAKAISEWYDERGDELHPPVSRKVAGRLQSDRDLQKELNDVAREVSACWKQVHRQKSS